MYSTDVRFAIENEGVTPNIEVEFDRAELARLYDAQLNEAEYYLGENVAEEPRPAPTHLPFPKVR